MRHPCLGRVAQFLWQRCQLGDADCRHLEGVGGLPHGCREERREEGTEVVATVEDHPHGMATGDPILLEAAARADPRAEVNYADQPINLDSTASPGGCKGYLDTVDFSHCHLERSRLT